MIFDSLFEAPRHRAKLIVQADEKIQALKVRRTALDEARTVKLQRQVDLWSILNLDSEAEEEYFRISALIAELIKEIAAIDEYVEDLRMARVLCENTKVVTELERLLAIEDPWAEKIKLGTQDALPRIPTT